jgi:folate-binding protein YgfZ
LGLRPAGFDALEILRVEEGIPRFGQDMDERTIPMEANLEAAINYDKGCYIGQEVIARATYRGHVNKKLCGLILGDALPSAGAALRRGDKSVGWMTSAVQSPGVGKAIALGYVQRDSLEPGTRLEVEGYPEGAVIHALPFIKSGG